MKIQFLKADHIPSQMDGMEVRYIYTVNDEPTNYYFYAVGKGLIAWRFGVTNEDKFKYSEEIFAAVIDYFKYYWSRNRKLPPQDYKHFEKDELRPIDERALNWQGYTLNL